MDARILSEHPVSDAMRATILQCLRDIEAKHRVKVLFACESGSRGWGFASPDSDYDVRFVYVNRLDWYLTVEPGRDVIEQPISGELDVNGWDLRKALKLLQSSTPVLLEWLRSPIVYMQDATFAPQLRSLAERHMSLDRAYHHYVSMAKKNLREHLLGEVVRYKKYLYVLRPLLAARWIREGRGAPPMRFADLAQGMLDDPDLIDEINQLLEVKMRAGEAATSLRWEGIHAFLSSELEVAQANAPPAAVRRPATQELDELLRTCVRESDIY
jgi:predicted nucleotidyltransferase